MDEFLKWAFPGYKSIRLLPEGRYSTWAVQHLPPINYAIGERTGGGIEQVELRTVACSYDGKRMVFAGMGREGVVYYRLEEY